MDQLPPSTPSPLLARDPFIRLTPVEVAASWAFGETSGSVPPVAARDPRSTLETIVREALSAGPTFVLFSGGRDSSAVLAVAVHVARREGFPLPVPVTAVFPRAPEAEESSWQMCVLEHLGLAERVVVTVDADRGWLGNDALSSLLARGLLWPPGLHQQDRILDLVRGGTLLTGEGGDEILGTRRITPLTLLLRRRGPNRAVLAAAARSLAPSVAGRAYARGQAAVRRQLPWLRGAAARAVVDSFVEGARSPWSAAVATRALLRQRAIAVLEHNYAGVAADHDVTLLHPLRSPRFVAALAEKGGFWGFEDRTHAMRSLFSDLLPEAVLSRATKAFFDDVRFGPQERGFAVSWTGEGVDPDLVDADALRAHWLGPDPLNMTAMLLHQAWLATRAR